VTHQPAEPRGRAAISVSTAPPERAPTGSRATARKVTHLRDVAEVVDGRRRSRRPATAFWSLLLLVLTLGALGHVAVHLKSFEVAYELGKERKLRATLEEERRRLELEVSVLKDPGRVMAIARERLGMAPPTPESIVALRDLGAAAKPAVAAKPPAAKPVGKPAAAKGAR
jgi:cell division protein FtsL